MPKTYVILVYKPETVFNLAAAARIIKPHCKNYKQINKRINWLKENAQKWLFYVPVNLKKQNFLYLSTGFLPIIKISTHKLVLLLYLGI